MLRGIVAAGLAAGAAPAQEAPTANLCLAAEYVYAGARLLAVDRGPLPTVSFQSSLSSPSEAGANAPVAVVVTTAGGCTTGGNVVVQYSTGPGTATAGTDYTAVPAGSLTIPAGTASGAGADINIALTNDPLDEDGETFTVNLSSPTGAVLAPPFLHTVTIADDDPEPVLAITDTSTVEPATVDVLATHTVSLIPQSGRTVTVNYGTAGGTATAGPDFTPASGVLTFPPGTTSRQVQVAVRPDDLDEPNETFFVNLGPAVNVNVPASDMVGQGTIQDIDPPPSVSVANASQFEGDEGGNRLDFLVSLSGASGFPITVNYTTADGTAVAPGDYAFTSGQVSFATGETTRPAPVALVTDAQAEPDETLLVNLSAPVNATLGVSQATGVIRNDDPGRQAAVELSHAAEQTQDLRAIAGVAATHWYRIGQKPRSSYEVVVDATSGDVGTDTGLELARVSWDFTTVRQQSVAVTPDATGKGTSRALRWRNEQAFPVNGEFLRVRSTQCGTDCGPDDVYRVRSFDTTCAVPRFNNVTGQATVLLLQNASAIAFSGTIDFWDATGALRASVPFALAPRGTLVHNTALTVPDLSGSITIMHEGGYGDLSGKAVSIEPATGFTFDTPLVPRPR